MQWFWKYLRSFLGNWPDLLFSNALELKFVELMVDIWLIDPSPVFTCGQKTTFTEHFYSFSFSCITFKHLNKVYIDLPMFLWLLHVLHVCWDIYPRDPCWCLFELRSCCPGSEWSQQNVCFYKSANVYREKDWPQQSRAALLTRADNAPSRKSKFHSHRGLLVGHSIHF